MTDKYAIDSHKLQYHPERVSQVLNVGDWEQAKSVYPLYVEVSPSGSCNARCTFCAVDYIGYVKRWLDPEIYKQRIREMGQLGVKSVMFAGEGEPLLHKQITQMIQDTHSASVDVGITTNAVPMTKNFIDNALRFTSWIKVSFNAGLPETYAKVHQCKERDYHKVIENLKYAVAHRKENNIQCELGLQCVLLPENAHEMVGLAQLCKDIGLDYFVVKPYSQHNSSITQQYKDVNYQFYMQMEKELEKFNDKNFTVVFRSSTMNKLSEETSYDTCMTTPYLWAYIMATGDVYGCSAYLLDDRFNFGNINEKSFHEIWEGDKRCKLFEEGIDIQHCRKNCRMDACNRYLDAIVNDKVQHVNFI